MGSTKVVLPEKKFSGEEDIREFLRDFEIYVAVNEWTDAKAGQYLAVFLKDDAKAFYHQQGQDVRVSYKKLSEALKERYEGGSALLKYKKEFSAKSRKDGESLHTYLSDLRLSYERAYSPPTVETLAEDASEEDKAEHAKQEGALDFYNTRKNEDILCQFINGLDKDLKEVLIRRDDLLKKPVESIPKQISTLEEEQGITKRVPVGVQGVRNPGNPVVQQQDPVEGTQQPINVEQKLDEILKNQRTLHAAAVRKGGKRVSGRQRPGPKPTDICRACNGQGHWARSCPSFKRRRGWPQTPGSALKCQTGVRYTYRCSTSRTKINTVQGTDRKSYHVEGWVNGVKTTFLIDTGAEVSPLLVILSLGYKSRNPEYLQYQ